MWVRLPVIPQRAAPGADLGAAYAAYLICSMTSVTGKAGGVALVGLTS
jgi:hypothetical protein